MVYFREEPMVKAQRTSVSTSPDNSGIPAPMPRTTVVHVKDGCDEYIGRAMPGYAPSVFQNEYRVGPDGTLDEVLDKFEIKLRKRLENEPALRAALQALKGKRIGCWCKRKRDASGKPKRCHGDLLVFLLEGPEPEVDDAPVQMALF
jgi:hypothetical protein